MVPNGRSGCQRRPASSRCGTRLSLRVRAGRRQRSPSHLDRASPLVEYELWAGSPAVRGQPRAKVRLRVEPGGTPAQALWQVVGPGFGPDNSCADLGILRLDSALEPD